MKNIKPSFWLLLIVPAAFLLWFFLKEADERPLRSLPYYGPKYRSGKDSVHHRILPFHLVNQYGDSVRLKDVENKIILCEFFFTTCQSICPVMNEHFRTIYNSFSEHDDLLLLSHTVDPEQDSVPVLRAYADRQGVKDKRWQFLTGDKVQLYHLARKSYLLNAEEGNGGQDDFIHTQNFALVDKQGCIRGYYDGTDSLEINRLKTELKLLFAAYDAETTSAH